MQAKLTIDSNCIQKALSLFYNNSGSEGGHILVTKYDGMSAELNIRSAVTSPTSHNHPTQRQFIPRLNELFKYSTDRLSDFLARHRMIVWIHEHSKEKFDGELTEWDVYGSLAIKDFHVDLGSLMDSIAAVTLHACKVFDASGKTKLPGFADIQNNPGNKRALKFRDGLPIKISECIDSTDGWWPTVKKVRDILTHREHLKLTFNGPRSKILFQVYENLHKPLVMHPYFLCPDCSNVADFRLYSAYVIAEVLNLVDDLGGLLAAEIGLSTKNLTKCMRMGDFVNIIAPLQELIDIDRGTQC